MRLITDRPKALTGSFVLMGVTGDSMKQYACLFDTKDGKTYVEEMYWTMNVKGNEATARLKAIEDDEEWKAAYDFVTKKTTVFSPKKLRLALVTAGHRNVQQIDDVIENATFPYAMRKIDPLKSHKIMVDWKLPG